MLQKSRSLLRGLISARARQAHLSGPGEAKAHGSGGPSKHLGPEPLLAVRDGCWGRYHPVALDDTKLPCAKVRGTCTLHGPRARSPKRAEPGHAHNWVGLGDLVGGTL